MSLPKNYKKFEFDSGNEEQRMSESESYPKAEFFRKPNFSEYLPNVPKCGFNTRHDNREVALIHLTRAQTLRCDKCATGSIHANGRRSFLQVLQFAER